MTHRRTKRRYAHELHPKRDEMTANQSRPEWSVDPIARGTQGDVLAAVDDFFARQS